MIKHNFDPEAEEAVLGTLLSYPEARDFIFGAVSQHNFSAIERALLFSSMAKRYYAHLEINAWHGYKALLESPNKGGLGWLHSNDHVASYLRRLAFMVSSPKNIESYCQIIIGCPTVDWGLEDCQKPTAAQKSEGEYAKDNPEEVTSRMLKALDDFDKQQAANG